MKIIKIFFMIIGGIVIITLAFAFSGMLIWLGIDAWSQIICKIEGRVWSFLVDKCMDNLLYPKL